MWNGFYHSHRNDDYIRATAVAVNGTGNAQGFIGPVPQGYCWYVERYTTRVATPAGAVSAATPLCEVAALWSSSVVSIPTWDRVGRQDYTAQGRNDVSDNESPIYLGPGQYLVAVWTAATAGDICVLTTQIRVHQLMPVTATPAELIQIREFESEVPTPVTVVDERDDL